MVVSGKANAKRQTYTYVLGYNNTEVCRRTFMDTYAVLPGLLKGINARRCKVTGTINPTMRGKSKLNNKISFIYLISII